MSEEPRGLVFNVQGYTVHDGPGIRTEIFMKGCPLSCKWCSNPEGLKAYAEPGIYGDKCMVLDDCTRCIRACKNEALLVSTSNKVVAIDRGKCKRCLDCANACFTGAIKPWGEWYSVSDAMAEIRKDKVFYEKTGGGVTISGGEALLQPDFVLALLKQCKEEGFHTCVETALFVDRKVVEQVMPFVDMFICDIKTMDSHKHKEHCGVGNEKILANLEYVASTGTDLVIRTPVLRGFNATEDDMRKIGEFILNNLGNNILQHQLLPFRQMGTEKYKSLNLEYPMGDFSYEREEWEPDFIHFIDVLTGMGVNAVTGNHQKLPTNRK